VGQIQFSGAVDNRERIRQLETKTMPKLRHPSRSQTLRDYLD
jgi:DNA-directed RNA polymerase sigma subunit (sigma70/sigma32)